MKEIAVLAAKARAEGFKVGGGSNGGGWFSLAIACGFIGYPTRAQAKEFLRRGFVKVAKRVERKAVTQLVKRLSPGFATSPEFLESFAWRRLRLEALKLHGAACQCCGASAKTGAVMNVDHIKPRKKFPHLALDLDNLQVLCAACNHGKGNWDQTDWRPTGEEVIESETKELLRGMMGDVN